MEIVLTPNQENQINVTCDGQFSHIFALMGLLPQKDGVLTDPVKTGQSLFAALFAVDSPARAAWDARPKRILLVTEDAALDAIPWEYLYGPNGFIVLDCGFVRGLSVSHRQPAPDLTGTPLHIVAIPSNPIDHKINRLDIAGEWTRLKDSIRGLETAIRLERVRPPTLEQTRRLVANQRQRVVHFMGHGGHNGSDSFLFFENEHGGSKPVTAQDFIRRMEDSAFLVTLNACVSATPGRTEFSNLARALTERGVPYALGMRFTIPDSDAKAFSETFYSELARGSSVENALRQARNTLAESNNLWVVGTPVLYTSLNETAKGFETSTGTSRIDEHQPPLEVSVLPRAEGAFQGRVDELLALGKTLTDHKEKLITTHGVGGQGKTALAREAVERFAHAWPGGVWAISLENKPSRATFCFQLAQFLNIPTDRFPQAADLECAVLAQLENQSMLIVLDNAETFVQAVHANDADALDLATFLKENLLSTAAGLLVTSREPLSWPGEVARPLEGLSEAEGGALFAQSAPQRQSDIQTAQAATLSRQLEGHPLALRLLGLAFNESATSLEAFLAEHQTRLLHAEDKYKAVEHRHRTLYASIETSTRYLDAGQLSLLSGLWIFHSPFQPETAAQIFTYANLSEAENKAQIAEELHLLWRRGLLNRESVTLREGNFVFYHVVPPIRLFAQYNLEQVIPTESLLIRMNKVYRSKLRDIFEELEITTWASFLFLHCLADFEVCAERAQDIEKGWYANWLGGTLRFVGLPKAGLQWLEIGLAIAETTDSKLERHILNNMGLIYHGWDKLNDALTVNERVLLLTRAGNDLRGEAAALNNIATIHKTNGNTDKALDVYAQALETARQASDLEGEVNILSNMGEIYYKIGDFEKAMELYEKANLMLQEVGRDWGIKASVLIGMGEIYQKTQGKSEMALMLFKQALQISIDIGDLSAEAMALNNIAGAYSKEKQFSKAFELYESAIKIRHKMEDLSGEATILNNVGEIYRSIGDFDNAIKCLQRALKIWQRIGNQNGEASSLNNIGVIHFHKEQFTKAIELYKHARSIWKKLGYKVDESSVIQNMASAYNSMGEPRKALELFEQALLIKRSTDDIQGEIIILENMAAVYRGIGQHDMELELNLQIISLMQRISDQNGEIEVLSKTALLAEEIGETERAIELLAHMVELKKLTENSDYNQDIATLARLKADLTSGKALLKPDKVKIKPEKLQIMISNTVHVMTKNKARRSEWQKTVSKWRNETSMNDEAEKEFFEAILVILLGQKPSLAKSNHYSKAIQTMIEEIYKPEGFFSWIKKFSK